MSKRRVFLGMPGYGTQTPQAGRGFWRACADTTSMAWEYRNGSLLASNFNQLWCTALNMARQGEQLDYFAMLHDDIGPEDYWLDKLIDELESNALDVLGVVVPIKDNRGMTSLALHREGDNWLPQSRLSMRDVFQLPETFTSEDIGYPLLLNTGCWVCKFDPSWAQYVHFTINDRIVFNSAADRYQAQTEPEDWCFSRQLHEIGAAGSPTDGHRKLRIGATRKIRLIHSGRMDFQNIEPWGTKVFDDEATQVSPVPLAFPEEIPGWLKPAEGAALAELAQGKRVLEIGSYKGRSTVCLGRTAEHVTAVDYFDGRGTPAPEETLQAFLDNIERYGLSDKVCHCHPEAELPLSQYELIFIDGAHDRESVAADVARYRSYLAPGGLMAFHDYNEPCHPGVAEAVDSLLAEGGKLVSVHEKLAVVKPPALIPLEV